MRSWSRASSTSATGSGHRARDLRAARAGQKPDGSSLPARIARCIKVFARRAGDLFVVRTGNIVSPPTGSRSGRSERRIEFAVASWRCATSSSAALQLRGR